MQTLLVLLLLSSLIKVKGRTVTSVTYQLICFTVRHCSLFVHVDFLTHEDGSCVLLICVDHLFFGWIVDVVNSDVCGESRRDIVSSDRGGGCHGGDDLNLFIEVDEF